MAGKQRAVLEQQARGLLADIGIRDVTVCEPRINRPAAARLEIVHPRLDEFRQSDRSDQMKAMEVDGTAATVLLELAQMTKALREGRIRATADYVLGHVVISWGRPPEVDIGWVRQELASRSGGEPVPDDVALVAWAGSPRSEVDILSEALQEAAHAITGGCPPAPVKGGRQRTVSQPPRAAR